VCFGCWSSGPEVKKLRNKGPVEGYSSTSVTDNNQAAAMAAIDVSRARILTAKKGVLDAVSNLDGGGRPTSPQRRSAPAYGTRRRHTRAQQPGPPLRMSSWPRSNSVAPRQESVRRRVDGEGAVANRW
jgi:hypothetical protein